MEKYFDKKVCDKIDKPGTDIHDCEVQRSWVVVVFYRTNSSLIRLRENWFLLNFFGTTETETHILRLVKSPINIGMSVPVPVFRALNYIYKKKLRKLLHLTWSEPQVLLTFMSILTHISCMSYNSNISREVKRFPLTPTVVCIQSYILYLYSQHETYWAQHVTYGWSNKIFI